MEPTNDEKRKLIIEKISRVKNISLKQAKELLNTLETYCELIINYTLKNPNEQQ
jgi:hypothetical protein